MGNCMERSGGDWAEEEERKQESDENTKEMDNNGVVRAVKIVLSREEVEWVLFQLQSRPGRKIDDLLEELESYRKTGRATKWKPSLESITEHPEVCDPMER
nr:uncharacterized protein LOC114283643 [Ipomoea batatas]